MKKIMKYIGEAIWYFLHVLLFILLLPGVTLLFLMYAGRSHL